jgi:protein-tyrosine phosphatase
MRLQRGAAYPGKMIDLHCHILSGIDDGARDAGVSLAMARAFVADGVTTVACTPHILPGVFANTGPQIRAAVAALQQRIDEAGIGLRLVTGADNHVDPDFVGGLRSGRLLSLADSRYVLVEPPHHVAPPRIEDLFFAIMAAGYVPVLTHPERLSWIAKQYETIERLVETGAWMQVTSGSLAGAFGRTAQYWGEKMLCEGRVHILATDAHNMDRRPPDLARGRQLAAKLVGDAEAERLVLTRTMAVLANEPVSHVVQPLPMAHGLEVGNVRSDRTHDGAGGSGSLVGRLRRFFEP